MRQIFTLAFLLSLAACSANVSAPAFPPVDGKSGGDLPVPTSNAGQFYGAPFVATKAVIRADGFYPNYYEIQLLPAEATSACSGFQNKYVEVNAPKATPEAKIVMDSSGTMALLGRFYDYAGGQNKNMQLANGWFQISNLAATSGSTITININDGTADNYIYGVYPLQKCF